MNHAFDIFDRWSAWASERLYRLGVYVSLPALVILVTTDVVFRYFLNAPIAWVRDVNGLLLLVSLFTALPYAWDRGYHIRMELFYTRFAGRVGDLADVLSAFCGVVFFGLLAVQAMRFLPYMASTNETGEDLVLPLWPFMAFMGLCGVVFVARLVANPRGASPSDDKTEVQTWM